MDQAEHEKLGLQELNMSINGRFVVCVELDVK